MKTTYATDYAASLHDPEAFWAEQGRQLHWFHRPPRPVLGPADPMSGATRWFAGGQLNTCWLCLDYHVENGRAEQVALIYDSPVTQTVRRFTYRELLDLTSRFAGGLHDLGVEPGDRVLLYMPNLPEAVVAMLACARLGAVHSVVFGGFAPHELAVRIDDARPRIIICASAGLEFDKVVPYKPLVDAAIRQATHQPDFVVVLQRDFCPAELTPAGAGSNSGHHLAQAEAVGGESVVLQGQPVHPGPELSDQKEELVHLGPKLTEQKDELVRVEPKPVAQKEELVSEKAELVQVGPELVSEKGESVQVGPEPVAHKDELVQVGPELVASPAQLAGSAGYSGQAAVQPRAIDYQELLRAAPVAAVPVDATDPLYILYTSGTTGKPKGVVRDNGGHAVALRYSLPAIYDVQPGDTFWAASDIGWAVGHSYIVYGPLLLGCTSVLFEGKPVRTPDAGTFWRVVQDHQVKVLFTAPTAIRAIKKEDPEGHLARRYNLGSLRALFVAGERCDPATYQWAGQVLGVPVVDHWWQTESGWPMLASLLGYPDAPPPRAGSAGHPVPGYAVQVLDEAGQPVPPGTTGLVAVQLPLPPGCLPTLWQDEARFRASYLSTFPGYYFTGDGGYQDPDGYLYIMGRVDDVINVAGHRLSTGQMEELLAAHPAVAECAVLGIASELRGQVPVGLVVLKDGYAITEAQLEQELVALIREKIGAVACFRQAAVVLRLPKTRSGKILRKTLRQLADGEDFAVPSTIDDPLILDEIRQVMSRREVGQAFEKPKSETEASPKNHLSS